MNVQPNQVFFTDRDLGKQFPAILKEAGVNVERHADYFADNARDEDWLTEIGKRGWYVLTHNRRIRYTPNEISAVEKFRIGLLVIVGKAPFAELAKNFVLTMPKITIFINSNQRPFIAKIYRPSKTKERKTAKLSGTIKMWVPF